MSVEMGSQKERKKEGGTDGSSETLIGAMPTPGIGDPSAVCAEGDVEDEGESVPVDLLSHQMMSGKVEARAGFINHSIHPSIPPTNHHVVPSAHHKHQDRTRCKRTSVHRPCTPERSSFVYLQCMTFGEEGEEQARVFTTKGVQDILDVFKAHGHHELDTARMYGFGGSERKLQQVGAESQGFVISTKSFPSARNKGFLAKGNYTHSSEDMYASFPSCRADVD